MCRKLGVSSVKREFEVAFHEAGINNGLELERKDTYCVMRVMDRA